MIKNGDFAKQNKTKQNKSCLKTGSETSQNVANKIFTLCKILKKLDTDSFSTDQQYVIPFNEHFLIFS